MKLDVIKLAEESGLCNQTGGVEGDSGCFYDYSEEISKFAALVIEECAKVCEAYDERIETMRDSEYQAELAGRQAGAMRCAAAIRELKEPE